MQISIANIIRGTLIGNTMSVLTRYVSRVVNGGGIIEAPQCVETALNSQSLLQQASLLVVPSGYKGGTLYSEIPTNGNGDLTWTRASTALRTNSSGLLESMATGVPRLSYMYGSCPALLLEPQRTNLALWSNDFTNAVWVKTQSSIATNSITSPDGNTNSYTFTGDGNLATHFFYQSLSVVSGTTYTMSIYARKNTNDILQIAGGTALFGSNVWANFNLNTGVVGSVGTSATASIQNAGNGWYRCIVTGTATATTSGLSALCILVSSATSTRAEQNTLSTSVYVYGEQFEAGAYPTTYIPTTSATATRVADSFSRNNIYTNGLITASGGTWFVELRGNVAMTRDAGANGLALSTDSGATTNAFFIRAPFGSSRIGVAKYVSGTFSEIYTTTTTTTKIAIKWNGTTADIFANGTKVVSATSFTATALEFLNGNAADVPKFIQAMGLHPTPLTDTQCIELTTL